MSQPIATSRYLGPHTDKAALDVTLVLRRRGTSPPRPGGWPHAPARRADFARQWGADPRDLQTLRAFARTHGLEETGADAERRVLQLSGAPAALERAFGVTLGRYQMSDGSGPFLGSSHAPALPPELIAVLGLDRRPVARSHTRRPKSTPGATFTPLQLGQLYAYPHGTDGTGQAIALIELGGGFSSSDLTSYFKSLGIAAPPTVTAVSVAGGSNQPGGSADDEVMLDIEVSGALAPAAHIVVYFAPNTDQGFYEAISQAAHDSVNKPTVMSISWGGPESSWSSQSVAAMQSALEDAATLGLTVTVAAGDDGSGGLGGCPAPPAPTAPAMA
jgi:kumamolisin